MRNHFGRLGCIGLLAAACGDDGAVGDDESGSTTESNQDESEGSVTLTTTTVTTADSSSESTLDSSGSESSSVDGSSSDSSSADGSSSESSSAEGSSSESSSAEGSSSESSSGESSSGESSSSESSSTGPMAMCGNDMLEGDEICDGAELDGATCESEGFAAGTLACADDCTLDASGCTMCGNDTIDDDEDCDGADLGGASCMSLGLPGDMLVCDDACAFDTSGCVEDLGTPFGSDTGYTGYESFPAVLPCDDISAIGTATALGDDAHIVVPTGFDLSMYGTVFTEAAIGSNGSVYFGSAEYLGLGNVCMPNPTGYTPANHILATFWDDLNPGDAGEVYYATLGDDGAQRFVVQWDLPNFGGDLVDLMRFTAMFHEENGRIQVCYHDTINGVNVGNSGAEATSGIQLDTLTGFSYSCNTPDLLDGLLLNYVPI